MEKLALQNVPAASLKRSMRDFFLDLVDLTIDENGKNCLKSIPTNFGYIFFWYGGLNAKALNKYYPAYVPKERVKQIKKNIKHNSPLNFQSQIGDFLFNIVRDHPDVISDGHAEVHLGMVTPSLKQATVSDAARLLKEYALRLERLEAFTNSNLKRRNSRIVEAIESRFEAIDFITEKEVVTYADEFFWDDECGYVELAHRRLGCGIQIVIHFKGDENLGDVVERIDRLIVPLKRDLEPMFRFGKSRCPF